MEIHITVSEGSIEQQQMLYCNTDFSKAFSNQPRISNSYCYLCSASVYRPARSWHSHWAAKLSQPGIPTESFTAERRTVGTAQPAAPRLGGGRTYPGSVWKTPGEGPRRGSANNRSMNRGWNPVPRVWKESGWAPLRVLATGAHSGESEMAAVCGGTGGGSGAVIVPAAATSEYAVPL